MKCFQHYLPEEAIPNEVVETIGLEEVVLFNVGVGKIALEDVEMGGVVGFSEIYRNFIKPITGGMGVYFIILR